MPDEFQTRVEQRRRALEEGLDLLGWVFDPLDSAAAHLGIARLGAVVERYLIDNDRIVAEWWIRRPHVQRRLSTVGKLTLREREAAAAPVIKRQAGARPTGGAPMAALAGGPRRVWVEIPLRADEAWREHVREVFVTCFSRGYRVVDFVVDNPNKVGRYLLTRQETSG